MQETQQQTVFGESIEQEYHIETTGRVIRPFKRMIGEWASEFKLSMDADGLHVRFVDAANVGMVSAHLSKSALDTFDLSGETVIGVPVDGFSSAIRHARYGASTDDEISITGDSRYLITEVNRSIGGTSATVTERSALIDPDSVRQEPDLPDLEFDVTVDISPDAFIEAVRMLDTDSHDAHIKLGTSHGTLTLQQESDLQQRNVDLDADVETVCEWAQYAPDYFESVANTLQNGYVDTATLKFSEEFPLVVEYEREDVYHGQVMIAPRVQA